jgi:bla regulator protein BlaR1
MKFLIDWLPENLLQALGWTLIHSLWQLVLIASVLWVVLKLWHRSKPALKYGLAVGALVISLALVVGTFVYEYQPVSVASTARSVGEWKVTAGDASTLLPDSGIEYGIGQASIWIEHNIPMLVNLWFLGALLFLFRMVNSLSEIRNLRRSSSPVDDFQLQKTLYRLVGKMGIRADVQLRISDSGVSPLTFGVVKPVILFPAGLLFHLSPAQLEAIIAHELAHVKRNDYLANLLLSGLEVMFFYHPCYWWMNSTVKELRENAADDLVVNAGIEPKSLATSLAEVLNFARRNPPELALAAGKQRNPTLQRIKRILGYPSQNYPQTPIISIPMLLTLFLSVGMMASAQPDAHLQIGPLAFADEADNLTPAWSVQAGQDTVKKAINLKDTSSIDGSHTMVITSDSGEAYRIHGDVLIIDGDTVKLSPAAQAALKDIQAFDKENLPEFDIPMAPSMTMDFDMAPIPSFDFDTDMPVMAPMPPMPEMDIAGFELPPVMDFDMDAVAPDFFLDTIESQVEKEKWAKKVESKAKEWEARFKKEFEPKLKEFEQKMQQWESENGPRMKEYEAKIAEWQAANGPKLEDFEAKMREWESSNGPKMKEFEEKMKAWQQTHGPKMKEFEAKMKDWETAQKPKMEEFQRKMEIWQKEHQAKLDKFEKLIQSELKKEKN